MPEFDNKNRGALFTNKEKDPDDPGLKHYADMKGTINVDGVEYFIDAYKATSAKGMQYVSLKLGPKKTTVKVTHGKAKQAPVEDVVLKDIEDEPAPINLNDIPF